MENYKEKYKESLERARKLQETCDSNAVVGWMEYIFPELKESEDERIRRELIEHIKANKFADYALFKMFSPDNIISWLEKQGEQKPAWSEEDECYMAECINAIATKDGWSFEDKRKTKHWLKSIKERMKGE